LIDFFLLFFGKVAKKEKEKRSLEGKKVRVQAAHAKLAEARQKLAVLSLFLCQFSFCVLLYISFIS